LDREFLDDAFTQALKPKNIQELHKEIVELDVNVIGYELGDTISIKTDSKNDKIYDLAKKLKPWRKGPFCIDDMLIDSEWRSYVKYDIISPHLDIEGKDVLDIGCSNGYYMFRMAQRNPASLIGIDPSPLFFLQYLFIARLLKLQSEFYPIGIDDIGRLGKSFDLITCLGILYHRHNPIEQLKNIKRFLKKEGTLIVDNLIIEDDKEMVLSPKNSYAKMKNCYFIPSLPAFIGWLERAGFGDIELVGSRKTDSFEQRKTEWIEGESLEDFLDKDDKNLTIEGYPAPLRAYIKARC